MNVIFDHYIGFEGEPEIIFKSSDNKKMIKLWHGYFYCFIQSAVPNKEGWWESLALLYHTHTGWYASSPFELVEVEEALLQLKTLLYDSWSTDVLASYTDLVSVVEYASKNQLSIFVEYS